LSWKNVSVVPISATERKLKVELESAASSWCSLRIHLSISHDAGMVVAMVVAEETATAQGVDA